MSEQHSKYNDSRLVTIDEQICTLLRQRKEQNLLLLQACLRMIPFRNGHSNMVSMILFSVVLPID